MTDGRVARRWLRLDAAYCGLSGALALVLAVPLGRLFHLSPIVLVAVGAATLVWAVAVLFLSRSPRWRAPLRIVAVANAAAAAAVALASAVAPVVAARLLLLAIAAEVAAFAHVQTRLLRR